MYFSALYASCLSGNLVEQLWNFAWLSVIAMIHRSLLLVAIMGFFTKLAIIIGGPLVGKFLDYFPRVPAYNCLNVVQVTSSMSLSFMLYYDLSLLSYLANIFVPAIWCSFGGCNGTRLVCAGSASELSLFLLRYNIYAYSITIPLPRRLLVLFQNEFAFNLNSSLKSSESIDLLVLHAFFNEIAGASLFGIRLSKYGPVTCLKFAAGLMALVITIYDNPHMTQPVLPASRAYVLLYFNIVLTPEHDDSIFNAARELSFIGLCAIMSVTATFVSAILIKRLGILKILQTGIPSSKANLIGTTEVAVASLAESTMLGVAIIANDVSHFRYLAMLSLLSVVGSAFIFWSFLLDIHYNIAVYSILR
ncbi:hypothetical protein F8388_009897 [Cannabis sativa]|uniref:Solute carrier family 40 member n=1 Tax=Cannabis sativa TaxID=3483 RepID=A0A7J6H3G4_CANSA|nr:hypothetical protein F8388_009897 [Cannabis sativa]